MKLVKLTTFKDKFFGNAEFDFDDEHINTISGKNGSGKTSLFELISLVQKAYFCKLLLENGYEKYNKISICEWISQLIYEMLPQKDSHIELTIKLERKDFEIVKERTKQNEILQNYFCEEGINITLTLCNESTQNNEQQWKILVNEYEDILKFFWNLSDPQGIIVTRPRQNRHLKRKDSIRFLVFLTFSSIQADRRIFSAPVMAVWLFIQKQLCCFRICLMLPVVFLRRQIAVCFVDTLPVIKYPYILEHCGFGFLPCPEMLPVEPFLL